MTSKILQKAYKLVPELGFKQSLLQSLREAQYSDSAMALFPRAEYDLVTYHLDVQKDMLSSEKSKLAGKSDDVYGDLETLIAARLQANKQLGSPTRIQQYLDILRRHPKDSLLKLHQLSDELLFLAGDDSNDAAWYGRRLAIASVYASAELVQSQSTSFKNDDWKPIVSKALKQLSVAEDGASNVGEWLQFNVIAATNVIRSLTR